MKKSFRMRTILGITAVLGIAVLTGCGSKKTDDGKYTVGIGQFAEHFSLDNCREGFIEGLKEEGLVEGENLEILYDNANGEGTIASQINQSYVGKNADLICAIATPMAQAAFTAAKNTDIPVIYTAITDPVKAKLANSDGSSVGNISGTSDKLPVAEQLKMIRDILPDAKKLGIMYTSMEVNSEASVEEYKEIAEEYGFEIIDLAVSTAQDIPLAADSLIKNTDCITMITDNTVVSALPVIIEKAKEAKVPVFGSEIEQVKRGCVAAMGLDYVALGVQTGKMAAKVLKGEAKASEIVFERIEGASLYINTKACENFEVEPSDEILNKAAEVMEEISEE